MAGFSAVGAVRTRSSYGPSGRSTGVEACPASWRMRGTFHGTMGVKGGKLADPRWISDGGRRAG